MPEEYSKEQLWKLYEALPKELQEAIFSEGTANSIHETCTRNGLMEAKIPEIARYAGYVLIGLLPPDEFEKTLKEKLSLKNDSAKKVSQEISHLVFSPLKATLEALYKIEIDVPPEPKRELPEEKTFQEPTPEKRQGKDVYREPIG